MPVLVDVAPPGSIVAVPVNPVITSTNKEGAALVDAYVAVIVRLPDAAFVITDVNTIIDAVVEPLSQTIGVTFDPSSGVHVLPAAYYGDAEAIAVMCVSSFRRVNSRSCA